MPHDHATARPSHSASRGNKRWMALPILGGIAMVSIGLTLLKLNQPRTTVSKVKQELREIALRQSESGMLDNGGAVGPWWIAANEVNPFTDEFTEFRVRSGDMLIAAKNATLQIDPTHDTFAFELHDVVFTRILKDEQLPGGDALWQLDAHTLGPAPWGEDIIDDGPGGPVPELPEALARKR